MHQLQSLTPMTLSPCGHMARTLVTWPGPPATLVGRDVLLNGEPRRVIEAGTITDYGPDTVGLTVC